LWLSGVQYGLLKEVGQYPLRGNEVAMADLLADNFGMRRQTCDIYNKTTTASDQAYNKRGLAAYRRHFVLLLYQPLSGNMSFSYCVYPVERL